MDSVLLHGRNVKSGSKDPLTQDQFSHLITAQGGKHRRAALEGRLFVASNQAAVATTAALATTWTGLGIANPSDSGKIIIVHQFGWALSVAGSSAGVVGLMTSTASGFAAAITVRNCYYGAGNALTSVAYVDDGATIATPVLERVCGTIGTGATSTEISVPQSICDLEGSCILGENHSMMTYTTTATTAAAVFFFMWEEVPA